MGIIQRQGLKRSILTYLGVGVGALSTLFIYPLELEAFGMAQFLISTAAFFATFAAFGVNALPVRFFPDFENPDKKHHGFLGLLLLIACLGIAVFWALAWFFRASLYGFLAWIDFDVPLFEQNMPYIILICIALVLTAILETYTSNFKRVAIPTIFTNLFLKIGLPILIFLLFKGIIGETGLKWLLVGVYALIGWALAVYLKILGEWHIRPNPAFLTRPLVKEMASFALYGILGSFGSIIAFRIDTIMVTSLTGALNSGIYNVANYIANVIEIPFNSVIAILAPILVGSLARNATGEIVEYYKKGSVNLMVLGLLFYILAVTCMEDLFRLTPRYEELMKGKEVVWFVGLSKVIVVSFGISGAVLSLSKYYRLSLLPLLLLAVMNVAMNFLLIPRYEIAGAALATAISILFFQISNIALVWWRMGIHPFSREMIAISGLAVLGIIVGRLVPGTLFPLINIILKGSLVASLFLGPVLYFRLSPDLNDFLLKNLAKARSFLQKNPR